MHIQHYLQWRQQKVNRDGQSLFETAEKDSHSIPVALYQQAGIQYAKFFKMDLLSRVAFLAAELVVPEALTTDKNHIATVISTGSGCLEVDKKFEESRHTLASPALFVYTLPNIMLGEICIRHGFKGEQMCTVTAKADPAWFDFYVTDLLQHRDSRACLFGHVEATTEGINATLLWLSKEPPLQQAALLFNATNLERIFTSDI